jgi:hypothetical protein
MFSERIHNWGRIFELFTGAMRAIAISIVIPETNGLQSAGPHARSYGTALHQSAHETQSEWAMANVRLANVNR